MDLMTTEDVMRYFGVSRTTVERWRRNEGLAWFRVGPKLIRYDKSEVLAWAESREVHDEPSGD